MPPTSLGHPLATLTPRELTATLPLTPRLHYRFRPSLLPLVRIVRILVGLVPHA